MAEREKDMTYFEEFAKEIIGKVETDRKGFYTGKTKALAIMTNEVILSDDDAVFELPWGEQKELIKKAFYKTFPYMQ